MIKKITIIGPGVMGKVILSTLISSGEFPAETLCISGPHLDHVKELCDQYGILAITDNAEAAKDTDLIILAVKPQKFDKVAKSIKNVVNRDTLILSIVAGINCEKIQSSLGSEKIVRAMPNTPAQIGEGITVWYRTSSVTDAQQSEIRRMLLLLGEEILVEEESYLDMATALSGTGPAYVFLFMEALIDAGVHMGFPRRIAENLVIQTLRGSTDFYRSNKDHPAKLRNQVTSPGGTSAEALYYLEKAGFRTAISRAVWAAYERSITLGRNLNENTNSSSIKSE